MVVKDRLKLSSGLIGRDSESTSAEMERFEIDPSELMTRSYEDSILSRNM